MTSNIFKKLEGIVFFSEKPNDQADYVKIIGRKSNDRVCMYIKKEYIEFHDNLMKWKVILPKSNGSGTFGETLSSPLIGQPEMGHTQTFISIGAFDTLYEAEALLKYLKTKFARALLGILKVTQDNKKSVWKYVPIQDFSDNSDIDWGKSITEIDQQLYKKYNFSKDEIDFIENKTKPMP